ncbi:MAG TPA: entericidin A/B family lipoprotein [Alphaproteobacteria bacterium]
MADHRSIPAFAAALALGLASGLAGCNTVEGVGRDVSAAGDRMSDAVSSDDSSRRSTEPSAVTPQVPTGTSATSGPTGTSATSGPTGTSATSGPTGTSATSGPTGTSATSGPTGTSATSGPTGTSATSGPIRNRY